MLSALNQYSNLDFIKLVKEYNIAYHEKELGQLFCDKKSQQIIDMLFNECQKYNVEFSLSNAVTDVTKSGDGFSLITIKQDNYYATSVVMAAGGLSIPKLGGSSLGYEIAKKFDLKIIKPEPALVPLTLSPADLESYKSLAGVSINIKATAGNTTFHNYMLFTHRGISGPAILQISSYLYKAKELFINFIPTHKLSQFLVLKNEQDLQKLFSTTMPKSFISFLTEQLEKNNLLQFKKHNLENLYNKLAKWPLSYSGNEGYQKAEVTIGGVDTNFLSSKTFESTRVKNLYFIGEVVDVTGQLGGYNFQWAWSSGFCAGQHA
jgi:predicted Rossmann fold flavoprotein